MPQRLAHYSHKLMLVSIPGHISPMAMLMEVSDGIKSLKTSLGKMGSWQEAAFAALEDPNFSRRQFGHNYSSIQEYSGCVLPVPHPLR